MNMSSLGKIAVVSALALMGAMTASVPAQAGGGAWSNSSNGPTIYQTNWWYGGSAVNPIGSVPSTAVISYFSWSTYLSYMPAGTTIAICANNGNDCGYTAAASGQSTYFNGQPADAAVYFAFNVEQSTTHILSPYVYGGPDQANVSYTY